MGQTTATPSKRRVIHRVGNPLKKSVAVVGRVRTLQEEQDLRLGVRSINQVRSDRGLPPVSWGDVPWMPISRVRTDSEVRDRLLRVPGEEE